MVNYKLFCSMSCIFCQIVAKEIPNYTVYEDANCLAFLDIYPHAKGHTVVIPKNHAETIFDLDDENRSALFWAVKLTMEKIQLTLNPDGFNVGFNHGEAGGQAVPHLHFHILPRYKNDCGGSMHSILPRTAEFSVEEICQLFK